MNTSHCETHYITDILFESRNILRKMNAMPKGDLKTSTCFKNFPSNFIIENEILK